MLLVGTRKGAFIYRCDAARKAWQLDGPHFLGNIVNHLVADPRDGHTLLMAAKTGHLGPTVLRPISCRTRISNTAMTRIPWHCIRSIRSGSISRTIVASTAWTARLRSGKE